MALVVFEQTAAVLRVTLNRPAVRNAINSGLLEEFEAGLRTHLRDGSFRALMLWGSNGCFSAGADIRELSGMDETGIRSFHGLRERTFSLLENFPCPTFALIEKYALGTGLELALCCDFRICADNAVLGVPSSKLGIVESYEYLSRLVRAVGPYQAKKLVLTGEKIDAKAAFVMGLVEEIARPDILLDRGEVLVETFSKNSRYAMWQSKKIIHACLMNPDLSCIQDTALPMVESLKGPDFIEGTAAFFEKRKADFKY